MACKNDVFADQAIANDLVVVHRADGALIKGVLELDTASGQIVPPYPLPEVLRVRCETPQELVLVPMAEMKAIFFVKRHEGIHDHDEVKFFTDISARDLWVRIEFADGEMLEGRTENNTRLLVDSGVWLRPFDSTGNNVLVYVPKSSVVEFHVMGVAVHRPHRATQAVAAAAGD